MQQQRNPWFVHLVAVLVTMVAVLLRWFLDPVLDQYVPFVTLFGAVGFCVWYGGYLPAALSALLGFLACHYFFVDPRFSLAIVDARGAVGLLAYLITCTIIIILGETMHASEWNAKQSERSAKIANLELQEQLQQSRALLEMLPIGIWIGNEDCSEIHGNPAAYNIFGFEEGINASITAPKSQLPSGIRIRVNGEEVDANNAPMQTVARTGKSWKNFEFEVIHPDGTVKTIYGSAVPLLDEKGKVRQIIAAYADYTEKKKLEAAFTWQNDSNRILAEVLQGLLSEDDPQQIANKLFTSVSSFLDVDAILNYAVEERADNLRLYSYAGISEQTAASIQHLQFGQSVCGTVAATRTPIVVADIQNSDYDKAALVRSLGIQAYACNPLIIGNRLLGTLSFASRKRVSFTTLELEFFSTVSNFAAITMNRIYVLEQERKARHQAEETSRLKDDFLATVSHELRTPLNAIVGWSHLMRQNALTVTDLSSAVDAVYNSAINQAQIIDDLLDVARITSGKMTIQPEKVFIQKIFSSAINTISHAATAKNIMLNTEYINSAANVELYADPHRLQQAFWNILSNSVKFTPEGGKIEAKIKLNNSEIEITITDSGKGISQEFLPFIFDRFRQAESGTSRKYSGLGLGLAIAKDLIELHGGRISAQSEGELKGSTFTIFLPTRRITQANANDAARFAMSLHRPTNIYESNLSGFRILLVDDDPNTLQVLNEAFLRSAADIRSAPSAVEAVAIFNSWKPDLIISDLAMPEYDGFWLIHQIRAPHNAINAVPVIALTAYSSTNEREQVFKAGFNSIISKPVEPSEVLKLAAQFLALNTHRANKVTLLKPIEFEIKSLLLLGKKILLVEDDLLSAEMLRFGLEKAGSECRSAKLVSEALSILERWMPDAIISDLGLPDEDGFSLIKKIRALPIDAQSKIPALALSGFGKEEADRALAAGYQAFKSKPVDADAVIPLIVKMLKENNN